MKSIDPRLTLIEALEEYITKRAQPATFVLERYPKANAEFLIAKQREVVAKTSDAKRQLALLKLERIENPFEVSPSTQLFQGAA